MELDGEIYRSVLESLPTGVYLVDLNRRILLWNDGAEKITGYLRQEVIGRCCADNLLMHCDDRKNVLCGGGCPLAATMHDGRPREADVLLLHKDGQRVPVRVRAVPLRNSNDAIIGAVEWFDTRAVFPASEDPVPEAFLDDVTELPDRSAALARIQAAVGAFEETGVPFGVLDIAIDRLDRLLERDGRNAVDAVLYATAQTLRANVGPDDLVCRWSEDRLVAILRNCAAPALANAAAKLRRLAAMESVPWWGDHLSVTLSIGATVVRAGDTPSSLMERAGQALAASLLEDSGGLVAA
jgi:PAS domain S-box-containing protein/diguanylate cyclase (GGDEF)-like protein